MTPSNDTCVLALPHTIKVSLPSVQAYWKRICGSVQYFKRPYKQMLRPKLILNCVFA